MWANNQAAIVFQVRARQEILFEDGLLLKLPKYMLYYRIGCVRENVWV